MSEPFTETEDVTLTCHTPECGNADIPITLTVPVGVSAAVCGACGQEITDTRAAGEDDDA